MVVAGLGLLALAGCGTPANDAPDGGVWWYECFEEGAALCWRDQPLSTLLETYDQGGLQTPIYAVGDTPFDVVDTQGPINGPPTPEVLDATWLGAAALELPHAWDDEDYPPATVISVATAEATWDLAVSVDVTDLAFIPAGEPVTLTLYQGLQITRQSDQVLLLLLAAHADWEHPYEYDPPLPRQVNGAGLTFSVHDAIYCYGAEGDPTGNRQFGFDHLRVEGGEHPVLLAPGETREISTPAGTYRIHFLASWHRAGACMQYSDFQPWWISYEVVLRP
jgi:hypothetical protein